jgi:hypothetical protein
VTGNPPNYIAERRQQEIAAQQRDNAGWIAPWAVGIGAVALGAKVFGTALSKKGHVVANLLHFLGHGNSITTNVDAIANSGASAAASGASGVKGIFTSLFNLRTKQLQLGPIDLIRDVRAASDILGSTQSGEIRDALRERLTEHIHRRHTNYGHNTSFFKDELQRVRISEVLADQERWSKVIGENQWQGLKKGVEQGIVKKGNILDKNIFRTSTGEIRDTRLRNIFMRPVRTQSGDISLVSKFDVFGQASVFKSLLADRQSIAVLATTRASQQAENFVGPRFFIGGNVFGYTKEGAGRFTERLLATGQRLRKEGDRLEAIRAAKENRLVLTPQVRTSGVGKLVTKFERATGVGTSFGTQKSFFSKLIDPIIKLTAIARGKAEIIETSVKKGAYSLKIIEREFGGEIPEIVEKAVPGKIVKRDVQFKDLSFIEKFLTLVDLSPKYTVAKKGAVEAGQFVVKPDQFLTKAADRQGFKIRRGFLDKGYKESTAATGFYAAPESRIIPGISSISDFTSYLAYRTSGLASTTLAGISYAPAKTFIGNLARVAAVPMIYGAAMEALEYGDYALETLTGISPKKTLASIYATIRVNQQRFRETVGIQQVARSAEKNFPGSVDSELGFIMRSIVAPAAVFAKLSSSTTVGKAVVGAAAVFGLIGGPEPGQTSEELEAEYSGQTKVPVRKGRFWGMGTTPFSGGEISRYDYSWYHKLSSEYRYRSMYGSRGEYFRYYSNVFGVPFPNPNNLFGILNVFNPYKLEERHADTRPYEATSNMFEEVPVFGPLLASTVGSLIKPSIERDTKRFISKTGVLPGGLDPNTARALGIPELNVESPDYDSAVARLQKMANVATEPLGVYKFAMEFFGVNFSPEYQQRAESSLLDSPSRRLYGLQVGGMFGQTEFLRRFMLSDYGITVNTASMVNRVANDMPDWLPGSGSKFERDRSYFIDFGLGDPFIKIEDAESRLPGAGYESLNPLHSGRPGEYDPIDRFLILADVAPYSQAFKTYSKIVSGMQLDEFWQGKVDRALEYKKGMTSIENRYPRHIDSLININERLQSNPLYDVTRNLYDTVTHDFLAEIPWIGSKIAPFRDPYEKYRRQYVEGSEFPSWFHPYEDIIRPSFTDTALSNPIVAGMKGAGLAVMMSNPFTRFMNPGAVSSTANQAFINAPLVAAGGAAGASLSLSRIVLGMDSNYVPEHIREESDAIQYLDKLTYLKNRALEESALEMNLPAQAREFKRIQGKTMVGARNITAVRSALPRSSDKRYFDVFVNAPAEKREELLMGLPPYMSYALTKTWENSVGNQEQADIETAQFFESREIPSEDWLGWHPSVDTPSMKLKMIQHGLGGISDNYHRFGFYESHERTLKQNYPDLWNQSVTFNHPVNFTSYKTAFKGLGQQITDSLGAGSISMDATPYGARYTTRLQIDRRKEVLEDYRRELR